MCYLYTSYEPKDLEKLYLNNEDLNIQLIEKSNYNNLFRMIILIKSSPYHENDITKKINSYRVSRKIEEIFMSRARVSGYYLNRSILRQLCYVLKDDTSFVFNYEPKIYYEGLAFKPDEENISPISPLYSLNDSAFYKVSNYEEISTYKLTKDYFQTYFNEFIQKTYDVDNDNFIKFEEIYIHSWYSNMVPYSLFKHIDYFKDYTLKTAMYIYEKFYKKDIMFNLWRY